MEGNFEKENNEMIRYIWNKLHMKSDTQVLKTQTLKTQWRRLKKEAELESKGTNSVESQQEYR